MRPLHFVHILSDIGAGKLGTTEGVKRISDRFALTEKSHSQYALQDYSPTAFKDAKHIDKLTAFFQDFSSSLTKQFQQAEFPVVISGDHSNAAGVISAFCNAYPEKRVGVLWIDAHADLHTPYTTPSGNIHGMSLSVPTAQDNTECQTRQPTSEVVQYWEKLKALTASSKGVLPQDLCFLGLRSYEVPEAELLKRYQMPHFSVLDIREKGMKNVLQQVEQHFSKVDVLYVSFDVDALDASLIPATGTPEPEGFSPLELQQILDFALSLPQTKLFEITEFNPTLDADTHKHEAIYQLFDYAVKKLG